MPTKNKNLHGAVPDKCEIALLLVDVINLLDFPEAGQLLRYLPAMTQKISRLKQRAQKAGVPVIYVNDNFGRWRSDFRRQVEYCLRKEVMGCEMAMRLQPEQSDYFILKPKHSGFFATTLETLLRYLGTRRLIITGVAGNFCVLFTANDAYMRDYELLIPVDCVASNTKRENRQALELMRKFLKADILPSAKIKFPRMKNRCESLESGVFERRDRRTPRVRSAERHEGIRQRASKKRLAALFYGRNTPAIFSPKGVL
jgi:nicotinamidase-related amidase